MRHESVINRILSKIQGVKIAVRENLKYETFKGSSDFSDDDIPNWRAVQSITTPNIKLLGVNANVVQPIGAGSFVYYILIIGKTGSPSMNVGLTSGGTDFFSGAIGVFQPLNSQQYFIADGNIYFNISDGGSVNIYIYYLANNT